MRPNTHFAFDIAECMQQDDILVDAFTLERLHLRAKRVAERCKDPGNYEASVLGGVLNAHMNSLSEGAHSL